MQLGMVGLGKMGSAMVLRLLQGGHSCVALDVNEQAIQKVVLQGAVAACSYDDLVQKLKKPRVIWMMLPAGKITEEAIELLVAKMQPGDILIDGGNSFFKDSIKHFDLLKLKGIHFIDVGTSGGVFGLKRGYCLMIGGQQEAVKHCEPIFRSLAPSLQLAQTTPGEEQKTTAPLGYLHCGPSGAGHFVKMVHNGIEYGMMQSFAEGFDILQGANAPFLPPSRQYDFDLAAIAEVWRQGSVISAWLLDLIALALSPDSKLPKYSGKVHDSGEGRWALQAAIEQGISAEVLAVSLFKRFRSQKEGCYAEKMLSAMRAQFGGHEEPKPQTNKV